MNNSFFSSNLTKSQEQMISIGHKKNGKPIKDNYHVYPQLAAAGLWTTSNDLARFLIQIQKSINSDSTGAFLSQESIRELLTIPVLNDGTKPSYGLGFGLGVKRDSTVSRVTAIGHSGSNWGYTCNMWASLDTKQAVVIMCNRNSASLWPIRKRILERISETKN
jgi:CubicO group peptidase (beta-lactamase class C family)